MNKNLFFKHILCVFAIVSLASCDNDFNEIGTNIVGDDNFQLTEEVHDIVAYNQQTGAFQSNNLKINQLGIYDNPVFGKTIAHFVTQVQLETPNPTINQNLNPTIVSAILTIPYFNTKLVTDSTTGDGTYELDSIYGPSTGKMKLGIYESNKYINTIDATTQNSQEYYSDQLADFNSHIVGNRLNNGAAAENDDFVFSPAEQSEDVTSEGVVTTTKIAPRMRLELDKDFFAAKLLSPAAAGQLITNDVFKNYFRALHFKVEQNGDASQLAMLNFGAGIITVKYTQYVSVPIAGQDLPATEDKSIVLKLTGNAVNLFELTENATYLSAITAPNHAQGDPKLYLKGGQGSMAVLELFKQPGELAALRASNNKSLINDASISFFIDSDAMGQNGTDGKPAAEPNRIYLYDLNNKTALLDYYTDSSTSTSLKYAKSTHGGIIEKVSSSADARGTKYRIRITNYVRNLIATDTLTNVRLGLVVTEDINDIVNLKQVNKKLKTPKLLPQTDGFEAFSINAIPQMSGINPLGTILWGTGSSVAEDKKLKLIIHYTKPN